VPAKTAAKTPKAEPILKPAVLTLDGEKAALRALLGAGEDNHWQMGVHYNAIVDNNLATQGGFATAHEFFASEFKELSQATLSIYSLVAKSFSEDVAKFYGCTKLSDLVNYLHAKNLAVPAGDPGALLVDVPQKDGSTLSKKFAICSSADLRAAKGALSPAANLPPAAVTRQAAIEAALTALLGKNNHVKVAGSLKGGEVVWALNGIPDGLWSSVLGAVKDK
jgi:hypothetical protein